MPYDYQFNHEKSFNSLISSDVAFKIFIHSLKLEF